MIFDELKSQVGGEWEPEWVWSERAGQLPNGNYGISIRVMVINVFSPWQVWGGFVNACNPPRAHCAGQKLFDESIYCSTGGCCMIVPGACKGGKGGERDSRKLAVCTPECPGEDITPNPADDPDEYVDKCLISCLRVREDAVFLEEVPSPKIKGKGVGNVAVGGVVPEMDQFRVEALADILALDGCANDIYEHYIRPLMNRHFASIRGTRARIAETVYRTGAADHVVVRSVAEFKSVFENLVHVPTGRSFVKMWLRDPCRRTYDRMVYEVDPSKVHMDHLNEFCGFGFERVFSPADIQDTPDASTMQRYLSVIFEHVEYVFCNGDGLCAEYVHMFLAHLLQKRDVKTGWLWCSPANRVLEKASSSIGSSVVGSSARVPTSR